nr:hypothetical protein [Ningiella ruwaisensis]
MPFTSTPAIIDVEASGFGAQSYPIEIGIALPNGQRFCKLIRPFPQWQYWDDKAQAVHGICYADLLAYGEDPIAVCLALNAHAKDMTLYSDAWVVDHPWIVKLFAQAAVRMEFSISSLEMVLSEPQIALWDDEKLSVIENCGLKRHRASSDAFIIQQTFLRTRSRMHHSQ